MCWMNSLRFISIVASSTPSILSVLDDRGAERFIASCFPFLTRNEQFLTSFAAASQAKSDSAAFRQSFHELLLILLVSLSVLLRSSRKIDQSKGAACTRRASIRVCAVNGQGVMREQIARFSDGRHFV